MAGPTLHLKYLERVWLERLMKVTPVVISSSLAKQGFSRSKSPFAVGTQHNWFFGVQANYLVLLLLLNVL